MRAPTVVWAILLGVGVIVLLASQPDETLALTRQEALNNVGPHLSVIYSIDGDNVYPNGASCYRSYQPYQSKLPIGIHTGTVYSYGNGHSVPTFQSYLDAGRGAGNHKALYDASGGITCVHNECTGIDCSAFVAQAWAVPRFSTVGLADNDGSLALGRPDASTVRYADAFNKRASHVVLFASNVTNGLFDCSEASGGFKKCVVQTSRSYATYESDGYHPWVSVKLLDDPAALLLSVDALRDGAGVTVHWRTLVEIETAAFYVCRATNPQGPFEVVSDEIAAAGSREAGATYTFGDQGAPVGRVYYRLLEFESGGRALWHWIVEATTVPAIRTQPGEGE